MSLNDFGIETGWEDDDDRQQQTADWFHIRAGDDRECTLLLTQSQMIRYWGHWVQPARRFQPCTGGKDFAPLCPHCRRSIGKQVRYVQVVVDPFGTQWLWEFGKLQWNSLKQIVGDGSLAGLAVGVKRLSAPGNPPVIVQQADPWLDAAALPVPVDAAALLRGVFMRQALLRGKGAPDLDRNPRDVNPRLDLDPRLDLPTTPPAPKAALSPSAPPAAQSFPERPLLSTPDRLSDPSRVPCVSSAFAREFERRCGIPFEQATTQTKANLRERQANRDRSARRAENRYAECRM